MYTADNPVNQSDPSGLLAFEYAQQSNESAETEGAVAEEGGTLAQGAYDNTINDAVGDAVDAVDSTDTNTLEKAQELRIDLAKRSGHWGEQQFAQQYPDITPKERFSTSQGARIVDFFDKENKIAHEVKTGLQSLSSKIGPEIAKDAELLADGEFKEVIWHFYRSPITGKVGASQAVLDLLAENGIKVIFE